MGGPVAVKLAEALAERKSIKDKIQTLSQRYQHAVVVQEGDVPPESPAELWNALVSAMDQWRDLVVRINRTNMTARLPSGITLMEALADRDRLKHLHMMATESANVAGGQRERFGRQEIRYVATTDVAELRQAADRIFDQHRRLDIEIQGVGWHVDLAD